MDVKPVFPNVTIHLGGIIFKRRNVIEIVEPSLDLSGDGKEAISDNVEMMIVLM